MRLVAGSKRDCGPVTTPRPSRSRRRLPFGASTPSTRSAAIYATGTPSTTVTTRYSRGGTKSRTKPSMKPLPAMERLLASDWSDCAPLLPRDRKAREEVSGQAVEVAAELAAPAVVAGKAAAAFKDLAARHRPGRATRATSSEIRSGVTRC